MSKPFTIVRMYRQLLGDCFLIMSGTDAERAHILVDCGVLQGTPGDALRMRTIVEDVYRTCKGKLDLVIVTHEHWDHISGFKHAHALFEEHGFTELWMAWTEDPEDRDGRALQDRFQAAHTKMAALAAASGLTRLGLFGFSGPLGAAGRTAPRTSREIYDRLRSWAKQVRYLAPGMMVDAPGGLKAYVLGPPRDEKLLYKALPSKGEAQETYLAADGNAEQQAEIQSQSPFPPRHHWKSYWELEKSGASSGSEAWVRDHYFGASGSDDESLRRIDDGYAMELNRLAIRMDNKTNNSSLVIAFALPDETTMVFAADAQVGNWLSWGSVEFKEGTGAADAHDLLARARLYKVGHHGSHNATLKKDGLERMLRPDLSAMIPTDAAFALKQGKGWLMPNPRVDAALKEHTRGRILRGDWTVADTLEKMEEAERAPFKKRVHEHPEGLYVDLLVSGEWPRSRSPSPPAAPQENAAATPTT